MASYGRGRRETLSALEGPDLAGSTPPASGVDWVLPFIVRRLHLRLFMGWPLGPSRGHIHLQRSNRVSWHERGPPRQRLISGCLLGGYHPTGPWLPHKPFGDPIEIGIEIDPRIAIGSHRKHEHPQGM